MENKYLMINVDFFLGLLGVLSALYFLCVLAFSDFDDGNMPAIQLIPRGGLKSPP